MAQRITGHTRLIGLIADPIRHSKSPMMHNTAFEALGLDYVYLAFELGEKSLKEAVCGLRALGARGFNVSMPYKSEMLRFMDEVLPAGKMCGAVNTVLIEDGRLIGTSTDGEGYMQACRHNNMDIIGKKITILGAGGAATAITMQAGLDGVDEISIFTREGASRQRALRNAAVLSAETSCRATVHPLEDPEDLRREIAESVLLCNATGVGFGSQLGQCLIPDTSYLRPDLLVTDVIYSPAETPLLKMANEVGCRTCNGLDMMLYQGAASFRIWTDREMPVELVRKAL